MNDLISIIIPVHNGGKYLEKLFQSLVNQTYKNLEIVLIDDASSDNSKQLCYEFNEKYKNTFSGIKILCNEVCKGVSETRNEGLRMASGEYLAFLDSDDWIDEQYFEDFLNEIKNNQTDIEIKGFVKEDVNGNIIKDLGEIMEYTFCLDDEYDSFAYYAHRGVWSCLFKRSVIFNPIPITFDTEISIGEDLLFYTVALSRSKKNHYKSFGPCYHYVIYDNSSYNRFDLKKDFTVIEAHKKVASIISDTGYKKAEESAKKYLMYKCYDFYYKIPKEENIKIRKLYYQKVKNEMKQLNHFVMTSNMGIRWKLKWNLMQLVKLK